MSAPPDPFLSRLQAVLPTRNGNARSTAALLNNPGCARRAVFDAAGVDLRVVAERLGAPAPFGQSPFALGQGNRFEQRVKDNDYELLVQVVNDVLGIFNGKPTLTSVSLESVPTNGRPLIERSHEQHTTLWRCPPAYDACAARASAVPNTERCQ